ncbi:MAG: threonine synthase [Candidatus Bipolaricaulia bacterium]
MYATHLESALDQTHYEADRLQTTHRGRPLWVRYDLDAVNAKVRPEDFRDRPPTMWRYRELLPAPHDAAIVSLGEGLSPVVPCPDLGAHVGLDDLWIKDEAQMPTGTFKSRGLSAAVTMTQHFGVDRVAIPTAGNAGGALAAYAARAGMDAYVFMPADTPPVNQFEVALSGAQAFLVDGLITDCGAIVEAGTEPMGWFDVSTLQEPYRLEGKKTMGLELFDQFDALPDVILYPTGGGTGLIGMWKAFTELAELGWIDPADRPRMVAVQSDGCCPIVDAYEAGDRFADRYEDPETVASGLRVPEAVGDFMILDAVRESDGRAVAVDDSRIREWMRLGTSTTGVSVGPEAAACVGAAERLCDEDWIAPDDRVVLFNCGAAQKYPQTLALDLPRLSPNESIDWDQLAP